MKLTHMGAIAAPFLLVGTTVAAAATFTPKESDMPMRSPMFFARMTEDVTINTENIEGGVQTTITTDDAATLERLLDHPDDPREREDVDVEITDLENGIVIKRTSTDEETVTRIQEKAAHMQLMKSITRIVTTIDAGVQIDETSDSEAAVTMLQSREMPEPKNNDSNIVVTRVNIDNGVRTTITSTDVEKVEMIQHRSEKGPMMGKGGRKHIFRGKIGHGEGGRFIPHTDREE